MATTRDRLILTDTAAATIAEALNAERGGGNSGSVAHFAAEDGRHLAYSRASLDDRGCLWTGVQRYPDGDLVRIAIGWATSRPWSADAVKRFCARWVLVDGDYLPFDDDQAEIDAVVARR
jgi:hypothetical protein